MNEIAEMRNFAMNDIDQAEKILIELRGKREAAVAHGHGLGEERMGLSFGAHALNDKAARRRLDEINRESALHDAELRSLDCAIAEATTRVNRAQQAEARKVAAAKAEELRKHVDELAELPAFVDKHLAAALQGLIAFEKGVAELHQKGVEFPTAVQLRLGVVAVLGTWLQQLPKMWFNEISSGLKYRAPNERKTALSYWAQLEPGLRTAIKQRLGDAEQDEKAA
jgi:hypothetical protein